MFRKLLAAVFMAGMTLVGLEFAIRLVPDAIPLYLLRHFESGLRSSIASRLGLASRLNVREVQRDDGGPPLRIYLPFAEIAASTLNPESDVTVKMDEAGFCNPVTPGPRPQAYDAIVLGDSFTWCNSVHPEAAWALQFGTMSGLSVYNLGVSGVGPYEYLQLLKEFGLGRCPAVVVMAIYEGNDLRDSLEYERHASGEAGEASDPPWRWTGYVDSLRASAPGRNSYVFNLILALVIDLSRDSPDTPTHRAIRAIDKDSVDFRYTLQFGETSRPFNAENGDRDEVVHAKVLSQGEINLSTFDQALTRFVALSKEYEFVPLVLYIPSAYTSYARFVRFRDPELAELMPAYSRALRTYIRQAASRLAFNFIDATSALQAAAGELRDSNLLYFASNVHLTPEGHRVVARTLLEFMKDGEGQDEDTSFHAASSPGIPSGVLSVRAPQRPACRGS